ncbi:DUF6397 family protein [Streptomyces sp. NPDC005263]|uniref:DUF6397 family protein n=1 Tax=Streptomyces sp. NPDC005263 TaxID=3364711 RepID=UPI0036B9D23C
MPTDTITRPRHLACASSRAARELRLKRSEFDLAVNLGHIRTLPDEGGGGRHVPRSEIERLRASEGFPGSLRARVRTVGTEEGAAVMGVSPDRFTCLARLGTVSPVTFHLTRRHAVIWLYLAEELREVAGAEEHAPRLHARMQAGPRELLGEGLDLRPRNWRTRHLGFLLRRTEEPWGRAGAVAAFLDPVHVAEFVPDPYERSHVNRFRPGPPAHGVPGSPVARLTQRIMTAEHADEIGLYRAELTAFLAVARDHRPAPRATPRPVPTQCHPAPRPATAVTDGPQPSRVLFGRLRRASSRPREL